MVASGLIGTVSLPFVGERVEQAALLALAMLDLDCAGVQPALVIVEQGGIGLQVRLDKPLLWVI